MRSLGPKISVIVPSFNQGRFIKQTILSVINQTYTNHELIIIDGGSTDETCSILNEHEKYFKYWVSEKDKGQSHAINKGLQKTNGEIITWLNSDDFYEPDTLEHIVNLFHNHPEVSVIHGNTLLFGDRMKPLLNGVETDLKPHQYLPYMRFPQPSSFFKAEVFKGTGKVNEDLHYAMDFELVVKAILAGNRFLKSDKLLSHYRIHGSSKSNHDMKFLKEWETVLCKALASLKNGHVWLDKLNGFGISSKGSDECYHCSVSFTDAELEEVVLEHLHLQYHYHYKIHDKAFCTLLNSWFKQNYPDFYTRRKFNKYHIRQTYLPKSILNLGRKLLR